MSERAKPTGEESIDALTDELIALYEDYHQNDGWDAEAARIQTRRIIRDSCPELWEESAAEVECEKLRAERDRLRGLVEAIGRGEPIDRYDCLRVLSELDGGGAEGETQTGGSER